jgi:hypothetical protein
VNVLGLTVAVMFATVSVLSYGLAPVIMFDRPHPHKTREFAQLGEALGTSGGWLRSLLTGASPLVEKGWWLLAYAGPIIAITLAFIALVRLLSRHAETIDRDIVRRIWHWALAFTAICAVSAPIMVPDFWLSVGWGRMVVAGMNPYHQDILPTQWGDLPIDAAVWSQMTYGPGWAVLAAAAVVVGGSSVLLTALAFKVMIAAAWVAALVTLRALLSDADVRGQALGIATFGWLPIGVRQAVGDGHNDVVMVLFLLLCLYWLRSRHELAAALALGASITVKYVTAPLLLVGFARSWASGTRSVRRWGAGTILAGALVTATVALFYRGPDFFASTVEMARWFWFSPADAMWAAGELLRLPEPALRLLALAGRALFIVLPVYVLRRYLRDPTTTWFYRLTLSVMSGVLFAAVGHVWPWFLAWILPLIALCLDWRFAHWALGVALAAPFPYLRSMMGPGTVFENFLVPALLLYVFSLLWFVFAPRCWFPPDRAAGAAIERMPAHEATRSWVGSSGRE